jgi:hypothetical protein
MHVGARTARTAGLLYLIGSVTGVIGILYGPSLVAPGDASATARNILAASTLFRLSIVSALLDQIIFVLVALALNIAFLVGALWFFPLGYLVFTSGFLPRLLGVLLIINGLAYVVDSCAALLLPNLNVNLVMFTGWVEVVFALWLLIRGINIKRWVACSRVGITLSISRRARPAHPATGGAGAWDL